MNKKEIITSAVMSVVCILVIVGFTVAWYSRNKSIATVSNMKLMAGETGDIIVALESGGEDVSVLAETGIYADMGMEELTMGKTDSDGNTADNLEELAPGVYGKVKFYITPKRDDINSCSIMPTIKIGVADGEDGVSWYAGDGESDTEGNDIDVNSSEEAATEQDDSQISMEELYEIVQRHITFYTDEAMTQEIDIDNQLVVNWSDDDRGTEKEVLIYWKWHYEYPFTDEEIANLSDAEKEEKIREYDDEDMLLGDMVSAMKFYFTFIVQ